MSIDVSMAGVKVLMKELSLKWIVFMRELCKYTYTNHPAWPAASALPELL